MSKQGYRNGRRAADGKFQPDIDADVAEMINVYCMVNGKNKTRFINDVMRKEMLERMEPLKE